MNEEELEDLKCQQTEYEENIIGELVKENEQLQNQLQQKENIIKEVREYIHWRLDNRQDMYITQMSELLEILDKVQNEENK